MNIGGASNRKGFAEADSRQTLFSVLDLSSKRHPPYPQPYYLIARFFPVAFFGKALRRTAGNKVTRFCFSVSAFGGASGDADIDIGGGWVGAAITSGIFVLFVSFVVENQ